VGFTADDRDGVWRFLAAALNLGNVGFGDPRDEEAKVDDPRLLDDVADLLRCDGKGLEFALTKRKIRAGRDFIDTPSTVDQAKYAREGMVKAMYARLFDWIVARVNVSLDLSKRGARGGGSSARSARGSPSGRRGDARFFIGILDIFGFEHFDTNSLEQLCINYTNERLQNRFNEHVFQSAQEENAVEGVNVEDADLGDFDNAEVLDLIGQPPTGILHLLNEECIVPQGSDETFHEKAAKQHQGSKRYKKMLRQRDAFEVSHYAGKVVYTSTGMLAKNKDTVSEDMVVLLQEADDPFVKDVFAATAEQQGALARKRGAKFMGVVAKFMRQLEELMTVLDSSQMHFVRCIKPNMDKAPGAWDSETLLRQLRCSGILEVVRVFGMGYPDRVPHAEIVSRFEAVLRARDRPAPGLREKDACAHILERLLDRKEFAIGRTKAFLKSGVLTKLRVLREREVARNAALVQAHARGMVQRRKFRALVEARRESKRREEEERRRLDEEKARRRDEDEDRRRREEEIARLPPGERQKAREELAKLDRERAKEDEERRRRREEEDRYRHSGDAERRTDSEDGDGGGGARGSGPFALDMAKVNASAAKAAALEDGTRQWTPRARPKDAPMQSARYHGEFKALPEDILEYAVYLGMDPKQDVDLLWIAEEALVAPDPPGWVEMLDPRGLLYFYNETTGQSSRQHPLDEHYQNLYLKMKMQRAIRGDDGAGADHSTLTTDDLQRKRQALAEQYGAMAAKAGAGDLEPALTSITQALSLSTPRSTKVLTEKFGISKPDTDVRALLINPARWIDPSPPMNETYFTREAETDLLPRLVLYLVLNENYKAFAFAATKKIIANRTEFQVSLDQGGDAAPGTGPSFAGRLRTNQKGQEWVMHDDSNDPYGLKTGQPRRELGVVVFRRKLLGPVTMELVIPRVRKDGACAQFRPSQPEEAMLQLYKAGRTDHMYVLRGSIVVQPGSRVELVHTSGAQKGHVIFRARKHADGHWAMGYTHPLSAFQAFNALVAIVNNQLTAALDTPPKADAPSPTENGLGRAGHIVNTATLEGLGDAVYALAVSGHKVFSGLYGGDVQVWHMDHYVNLPSGSKPEFHTLKGHSAAICALLVTERTLISASEDKTIIIWDLNTMRKKATLKGHKQRVRALATLGRRLMSAGNDKQVRVWNMDSHYCEQVLEGHQNWVRCLAVHDDTNLVSGSRDKTVKVWEVGTWKLVGTFDASADVYSVAAGAGFAYGGCADYKIRVWNLQTMQKSYMLIGHEGIIRSLSLFADKDSLYSCGEDKKVKIWNLMTGDCVTLFGHTKFVRCIAYEPNTKTLYSAGDDAKIKMWQATAAKT